MQPKILILLLIFFAVTGCKKKSVPLTNSQLLNQKPWKYKAAGIDLDKNGTIDNALPSTALQPCMLDNTYVFNSNGTGTIDEGATKCNSTAAQTSPFNWNFSDNETYINLESTSLFGLGGKFKVLTLNDTAFNMSKDTTVVAPGFPVPISVAIVINLQH
jgi:hypothetical protein